MSVEYEQKQCIHVQIWPESPPRCAPPCFCVFFQLDVNDNEVLHFGEATDGRSLGTWLIAWKRAYFPNWTPARNVRWARNTFLLFVMDTVIHCPDSISLKDLITQLRECCWQRPFNHQPLQGLPLPWEPCSPRLCSPKGSPHPVINQRGSVGPPTAGQCGPSLTSHFSSRASVGLTKDVIGPNLQLGFSLAQSCFHSLFPIDFKFKNTPL